MKRAIVILGLLAFALPVRADRFVIAPPWYDPRAADGEELGARIVQLVAEDLKAQGHEVVLPAAAARKVEASQRRACGEDDCAERYRMATDAVATLLVRSYRGLGDRGPATSFQIGLVPQPGLEYRESAMLRDGPLATLVGDVLQRAFRAYRRGPGPWLSVTGAPKGASIFVDDRAMGTLPALLALPVGSHRVRVEAQGFEPTTRIVQLPSASSEYTLEFRLEPQLVEGAEMDAQADAAPASPSATTAGWRSSRWVAPVLMATGGVLMGVGTVYLAAGARGLRSDGDCATGATGPVGCSERYVAGSEAPLRVTVGSALFAIGAASMVTGVVLKLPRNRGELALHPRWGGASLAVSGEF